MSIEETRAYTEELYKGVPIASRFMYERVIPSLQAISGDPLKPVDSLQGLYVRACFWMQSLKKLRTHQDYQAILACNRSLFEITVDLILLSEGREPYTDERMFWWEQSAKLKAAVELEKYFKKRVPSAYKAYVDFIHREESSIKKKREALWPHRKKKTEHPCGKKKAEHPSRWTGNDLLTDARKADKFQKTDIKAYLGISLEEFYETQMRRINTTVHGSALSNERYLSIEEIDVVCGLGYQWSTDLAMLCTKLILEKYDISDLLPELKSIVEKIKDGR